MTVLGGYLGAGKTTFLNRVLAEPGGARLAVLVNDFGDINIDAALIANQSGQTTALTNGCACCSINGDLYDAVDNILSSGVAYDRLVIEASGVADPAKLMQIAVAEPDLVPAGILTMVDAVNLEGLLKDAALTDSVARQIRAADRLVVTKADAVTEAQVTATVERIAALAPGGEIVIGQEVGLAIALLPDAGKALPESGDMHPIYRSWSYAGDAVLSEAAWRAVCMAEEMGVLRMKGFLNTPDDGRREVHLTGQDWQSRPASAEGRTELVAIGLADRFCSPALNDAMLNLPISERPVKIVF